VERDGTHARRYRYALGPERLRDLLEEEAQVGAARPRVREPRISVPNPSADTRWGEAKPQRDLPSVRAPCAGRTPWRPGGTRQGADGRLPVLTAAVEEQPGEAHR